MQTASSSSTAYSSIMTPSSTLGHASKYTTAASTGLSSMMANNTNAGLTSALSTSHHHHHHHPTSLSTKAEPSSVTWAPTPQDSHMHEKSSEIDRIMAKIEQARLSIANVCVLSKKNNHKNFKPRNRKRKNTKRQNKFIDFVKTRHICHIQKKTLQNFIRFYFCRILRRNQYCII